MTSREQLAQELADWWARPDPDLLVGKQNIFVYTKVRPPVAATLVGLIHTPGAGPSGFTWQTVWQLKGETDLLLAHFSWFHLDPKREQPANPRKG